MLGDIVGGVIGGGLVYLLRPDGTVQMLTKRPTRNYRGYPSLTAGTYFEGWEEFVIEPPEGWGWNILAAYWEIQTDATAVIRYPYINIQPRGVDPTIYLPVYLPPINASIMSFTYFFQGAGAYDYGAPPAQGFIFPLPMNGELKRERLTCGMAGGQVGDTQRMFIYFEEFEL